MSHNNTDEDPLLRSLREVQAHIEGKLQLKSTVVTGPEIEGYRSGMNIDDAPCPYAEGTQEHDDWQRGRQFSLTQYGTF